VAVNDEQLARPLALAHAHLRLAVQTLHVAAVPVGRGLLAGGSGGWGSRSGFGKAQAGEHKAQE